MTGIGADLTDLLPMGEICGDDCADLNSSSVLIFKLVFEPPVVINPVLLPDALKL